MENNEKIFKRGIIVEAEKNSLISFALGPVGKLNPLDGVIEHTNKGIVIHTKMSPHNGILYPQDYIALVRVIGNNVLIDGKYDIYAMPANKISEELYKKDADIKLTLNQSILLGKLYAGNMFKYLSFNEISKAIKLSISNPYLSYAKKCKIIIITPNMEVNTCYNEWDKKNPCHIEVGDAFFVTDEKKFLGYRISKYELKETYTLI